VGSVVVATFNIQHARTESGEVEPRKLGAACEELGAGVIALQEVDRNTKRSGDLDLTALAGEETGMQACFGPAMEMEGGEYGNALLVDGDLGDREVLILPQTSRYEGAEQRVAILAHVHTGGETFSVACTHLDFRPALAELQLASVLDALRRRPGPHLLMGDLNLPPSVVIPAVEANGWSATAGLNTFPLRQPDRTIDYVITNGFTVESLSTQILPVGDHRALIATLTPTPGADQLAQ
jgi:endonuclease/exonuclease/phosphatase family metal-dependent hydrolase